MIARETYIKVECRMMTLNSVLAQQLDGQILLFFTGQDVVSGRRSDAFLALVSAASDDRHYTAVPNMVPRKVLRTIGMNMMMSKRYIKISE